MNRPEIFDKSVIMSSEIPSLKYSCSGSPLMFANGKTAIEGLSGSCAVVVGGVTALSGVDSIITR